MRCVITQDDKVVSSEEIVPYTVVVAFILSAHAGVGDRQSWFDVQQLRGRIEQCVKARLQASTCGERSTFQN